jgi:hypothetical protein
MQDANMTLIICHVRILKHAGAQGYKKHSRRTFTGFLLQMLQADCAQYL